MPRRPRRSGGARAARPEDRGHRRRDLEGRRLGLLPLQGSLSFQLLLLSLQTGLLGYDEGQLLHSLLFLVLLLLLLALLLPLQVLLFALLAFLLLELLLFGEKYFLLDPLLFLFFESLFIFALGLFLSDTLLLSCLRKRLCLNLLLFNVTINFMAFDAIIFPKYFTNWTLCMTIASVTCSIAAVKKPKRFKKSKYFQATHNLLYTLAIMMNLVTMTVFWTVIYEDSFTLWPIDKYPL